MGRRPRRDLGGRSLGLPAPALRPAHRGLHDAVSTTAPIARDAPHGDPGPGAAARASAAQGALSGARPPKLNLAPAAELPIFLRRAHRRVVRLAGRAGRRLAVPFMYPRQRVSPRARRSCARGAARAGGGERSVAIYPSVPTVVADDPKEARRRGGLVRVLLPHDDGSALSPAVARAAGFEREVEAVIAANTPALRGRRGAAGGREAAPGRADRLRQRRARARARLAEWHAAGADMPMVFIRPNLFARRDRAHAERIRPDAKIAGVRRERRSAEGDRAETAWWRLIRAALPTACPRIRSPARSR